MKFVKLFVAVSLCLVAAGFLSGRAYAVDTLSHAENVIGALRAADDARAALNGAPTPRTSNDYKNDGSWRERDYDKQQPNGKAKGHYKGTPDGPPGQMDKHKDKKDKKHKNKHKD